MHLLERIVIAVVVIGGIVGWFEQLFGFSEVIWRLPFATTSTRSSHCIGGWIAGDRIELLPHFLRETSPGVSQS
jgi:hypothetical protein